MSAPLPRTWTAIARRTVGATTWDALPRPAVHPDAAEPLRIAGHILTRTRRDGRREVLEVRAT